MIPTMHFHGQFQSWCGTGWGAGTWIALLLAAGARAGAAAPEGAAGIDGALTASMRRDATLRDVCFVSPDIGWAVGDRGVIWHTRDAGQSWQQQASGVFCRLESVTFLDRNVGWAAGGWTDPYTHASHGLVLATRDGGRRWQTVRSDLLPAVRSIRFFDVKRALAVTRSSALFAAAVFATQDGGRHWTPLSGTAGHGWTTGDFVDLNTGAVAGHRGALAALRRRSLLLARSSGASLRSFQSLVLQAPRSGWLVGDGGLIFRTQDLGRSWQAPPGGTEIHQHFDFFAVAARGDCCWAAGAPGSRILRSGDGGRTWMAAPTGSRVPLYSLAMADPQHGWAVGALGTILATLDGGRSWHVQQAGGGRAAYFCAFDQPASIPLELIARLSAADGYYGAVSVIRRPLEAELPAGKRDWRERTSEAVADLGGCGLAAAWRFPLPDAALGLSSRQLVEALDRANDGQGAARLQSYLVRQIRMWRPSVVFTSATDTSQSSPLSRLVGRAVVQAVRAAGDPTRYVDLGQATGLEPWAVDRVYGVSPFGASASDSRLDTDRLAPQLGSSTADFADRFRGLVADRYAPPPRTIACRLVLDNADRASRRGALLAGLAIAPGSDARRMPRNSPVQGIEHLKRIAQRRRNLRELIKQTEANPAWSGQISQLAHDLDAAGGAAILYQLGQRYYLDGRWETAAEVFRILVDRYPEHPLAGAALVWLVEYHASAEAALRVARSRPNRMRQGEGPLPDPARPVAGRLALPQPRWDPRVEPAADSADASAGPFALRGGNDRRLVQASELGKTLQRTRPQLFADPRVRFALAVAHRRLGFGGQAERFYLALQRLPAAEAWQKCAAGERWLKDLEGPAPKPVATCRRAAAKPYLDGKLDEPFWQGTASIRFGGAATAAPAGNAGNDSGSRIRENSGRSQSPRNLTKSGYGQNSVSSAQKNRSHRSPAGRTEGRLAYDEQYLYLAVRCLKIAGLTYSEPAGARPRDADSRARDRLDLYLDVDRDYATFYRLSVDDRGWPGDSCWGDDSWNPTWYIAVAHDSESWTIEAAIPLAELTDRPPRSGYAWGIGLQRIVPEVGLRSWTQPANLDGAGEGFGYLIFE